MPRLLLPRQPYPLPSSMLTSLKHMLSRLSIATILYRPYISIKKQIAFPYYKMNKCHNVIIFGVPVITRGSYPSPKYGRNVLAIAAIVQGCEATDNGTKHSVIFTRIY